MDFFKGLLAKMVRLDKIIISAKYYLFTPILTTVTRTVKIAMFEHVCESLYSVHCDHHKNETRTFSYFKQRLVNG